MWVALIAHSRIILNQWYVPCSLYKTCLVHDSNNGRTRTVNAYTHNSYPITNQLLVCGIQTVTVNIFRDNAIALHRCEAVWPSLPIVPLIQLHL